MCESHTHPPFLPLPISPSTIHIIHTHSSSHHLVPPRLARYGNDGSDGNDGNMPDSDDGLGRVWSNFSLSSLSPTWDVAPDKVFALNATTTPLSSVNNVAFTTPQNAVLQGQWVLVKNATASSTSSSTNGTLSSNDTVTATASNDTLPQVTIAYHGTDCYFTADVTPANTSGDRVGYLMIDGKLYANASDPWDPTDDLISTDGLAYGGHTASFNVDSDFVGKIVFKSFAYTSYTETLK